MASTYGRDEEYAADAHRGRLGAENNADCGATFQFTLPVEKAAAR